MQITDFIRDERTAANLAEKLTSDSLTARVIIDDAKRMCADGMGHFRYQQFDSEGNTHWRFVDETTGSLFAC